MRFNPSPRPAGWIERIFLAAGVAAFTYVAAMILYAALSQRIAERDLEQETHSTDPTTTYVDGDVLGRLEIPSVGLSAMVFEGSDDWALHRGIGHIPNTSLPGRPGNMALTGHRDTFFRPLHGIKANDEITLITPAGHYLYRVENTMVVQPDDVSVLASSGGQRLTLITCYPFYFVGRAPKRFVVQARLEGPALAGRAVQ